jgi:hypothetical protein
MKTNKILGYLGTVLAIFMFFGLIEVAISNITKNTHIFIQPLFAFLTASVWSAYGFRKKDWFVFAVNIGGVFVGAFTIITAFI